MFNSVKVKDELVQWIKEWFEENGKDCNAVIGISGGKDSTVAAALCVEALGRDRVVGVLMPNGEQKDIKDSFDVCNYLDIDRYVVNIESIVSALGLEVATTAKRAFQPSEQAIINLSPRIRMSVLYFISQSIGGRVVCTDNLSESYIGYSTRWGDNVGDFAPLASFTTDEVIAIGEVLGLPQDFVHKTPTDGLCGKTDEDNFGFTYAVLNKYIRTGVCEDEDVKRLIDEKHERNLFKLQPIPSFKPSIYE